MNQKRTMSQALHAGNLSAEAVAFVAAGAAGTTAASAPPPVAATPATHVRVPPVAVPTVVTESGQPAFVHSTLPADRRAPVSMTFRLPAELPSALLRVAMERKLRGESPCTQQDIVAQAVREWLERNAPRG